MVDVIKREFSLMILETDMKKRAKIMMLLLAVLGLSACGTKVQPPDLQVSQATTAVTEAEGVGAYESAPVELEAARVKLDQAKQALQRKDNLAARRLAEEAAADANLAQAKARTAKSRKSVEALQEGIRTLQEEVDRKSVR